MFISAYEPGSEKSEEEIEEFWNELSECVGSFGRNESVGVLGDFNARMGNEVIEGIVGRHGVPGVPLYNLSQLIINTRELYNLSQLINSHTSAI